MSRPIRVLVAGSVLGQPMGGVRRHNAELLPRVAERVAQAGGHLAILEGLTKIEFALPEAVELIPSNVPYQPPPMRAAREARALRQTLADARRRGEPFDLVHTGHLPAPRRLGTPYTITIHDLRSLDLDRAPFTKRLLGKHLLERAFKNAARIGVVSNWMEARIGQAFPFAAGRTNLIGNGFDHLPLYPRAPASTPFLLHVGHVEPRKNLDLLVRALHLDPSLPRVVLAGRTAPGAFESLESLATKLGVQARIELLEHPSDEEIARAYAECACAVFPSRLEGFGIGPAEARRAGTPIAVSDIPAHAELLGDDVPTFGTDDPDGLVRAVERAVTARAPQISDGIRSWDDCAAAWFEMWTTAIP